jgi:WD40 repeat protein
MRPIAIAVLVCTFGTVTLAQPKGGPKIDPKAPYVVVEPGSHSATVRGVAFTPDSRTIVTAAQDRTVRLWDVATGDLVRVIRLPVPAWVGGELYCLAMAPDGKTIAVAGRVNDQGRDGSPIYVIDLETGRMIRTLTDHTDSVTALAFGPGGTRLASCSADQTARVWDVATGKCETVLRGHTAGLTDVAISPDGELIATTARDATFRIWPIAGGKAMHIFVNMEHPTARIAWAPDSKLVATGNTDGSISLWDPKGKKLGMHLHPAMEKPPVIVLAFTPDGQAVLCAGAPFDDPDDNKARSARIVNVGNGAEHSWMGFHASEVWAGAVSADGKLAVTIGKDQHDICIWKTFDGGLVRKIQGGGATVAEVAWSEDGKTIAWSSWRKKADDAELPLERTFHLSDLRMGPAPDAADKFQRALHARKERTLGAFNGRIQVYEGVQEVSIFNAEAGYLFGYSWVGDDLIVAAGQKGLCLGNPEDGKLLRRFTGSSGGFTAVAPAADNLTFATGGEDQTIRIWRADRGKPVLSILPSGNDWIAWTEDGLYACSPGGEHLMGWQLDAGRDKLATFAPAARFRSSLYRPDIIRHIASTANVDDAFAAAKATKPEKLGIAHHLPPTVEITSPGGSRLREVGPTFEVTATARPATGSTVAAMRLLVDGRPYGGDAGIRKINADGELKATWPVDLPPGPHTLIALADGASRGASAPVEIIVPGKPELPALYVLAIGISDYAGPLGLKCAAADAGAIAKAFQDRSKSFRAVEIKVLTDKDATRAGVDAGLAWLKQKTTARDIGVFFFSGRGSADDKGEFALMLHDAEGRLPAARMKSALAEVPGRVMVVLDAARPKSAGADDLIRDLLTEDCAAIVLSSCQGAERSYEEPGAKLGYFTQAIVESLPSAAGLTELQAAVAERVKELSSGLMTPVTGRPTGVRSIGLVKPQ